ncbi:conserved hypothetical protein [Aspergillus terreus NIH2624]|uniref:Uncharacterized protein n=1 Tax=Aspergillus terreus (strain NIH 2624 / FGSC A1156) TaxID=341663 RepID=Q0CFM2_ASPTN|nr:uncharacterized protein ATEG_07512 [Aspergillus terreus NIH2624]EAU31774.1 conserved hypothetical protein [Aspergillus terreus NIH2624]
MALGATHHLADLHAIGLEETELLLSAASGKSQGAEYPSEELPIPKPELFRTLRGIAGPDDAPTIGECAVHLEMLEVFHTLRTKVIQSRDLDVAFGVHPRTKSVYNGSQNKWHVPVAVEKKLKDDTFEQRRAEKWTCFLQLAAGRFHRWIRAVNVCLRLETGGPDKQPQWILPPLDILVVWHAFLLNPSDLKDYYDKRHLKRVQGIRFPWEEIHKAISSSDWTYTLPSGVAHWLRAATGLEPDLFKTLTKVSTGDKPAWEILKRHPTWSSTILEQPTDTEKPRTFAYWVEEAAANLSENKPLVDNVQRQCVFVDKMHAHRWICSPAVEGTLRRAVVRYEKFIALFRDLDSFLVPTLDVDLVWHTHQCSADLYRQFVVKHAGRFINHEDKISRGTLDNGFTSTEQWYRLKFGDQYQTCLCWHCEAILSAVEDADVTAVDVDVIVQRVERQVHHYKEVEISRRLGGGLPKGITT